MASSAPIAPRRPKSRYDWRWTLVVIALFGGAFLFHSLDCSPQSLTFAEFNQAMIEGRIHPDELKIFVDPGSDTDLIRGTLLDHQGDPATSGTPFCTTLYRSGWNRFLVSDLSAHHLVPEFEEAGPARKAAQKLWQIVMPAP